MNAFDRIRPSPAGQLTAVFYCFVAILSVGLPGCGCRKDPVVNGNGTTEPASGESEAQLVKINDALARTENLEPEQAGVLWTELRKSFPDDPSVALNRALNAVLRVDALTAAATDSVKSAEEKKAARMQLPDAIESARSAVSDYQANSGDNVTQLWLESRIDSHQAVLLGSTIGKSLRKELFTALTTSIDGALGEDPHATILGGPLVDLIEQLSDPVDGLAPEFLTPAFTSLQRLSDQNPANLFLALRALQLAIEMESDQAGPLAERTWGLASAVEPILAAYTKPIGLTPEDLKNRISDAVKAGDWAKAQQSYVLWTNVLNPLEIVRADRRKCSPHPLDRLSFDTVRRLNAKIAETQPVPAADQAVAFRSVDIETMADQVLAVDADLDLQMDLVTVTADGMLTLLMPTDEQASDWQPRATLKLDQAPVGIVAADLFMVDSSDSGRIKRNDVGQSDEKSDPDFSMQVRHNTLPGLILYGDFGIQLIQLVATKDSPQGEGFRPVEKTTGLEGLPPIAGVVTGDLEGDGDLDLIVAPAEGGIRTMINRGNRTFFEAPVGSSSIDVNDPIIDLTIADLDRDIDLDVVTLHRSGKVGLLENLLHLQFRQRYLDEVPASPISDDTAGFSITVEDVDSNVGWDVLVTTGKQCQVAFGNSSDIGVWTVDRIETGKGYAKRPVLADFDNDSYLEWYDGQRMTRLGPWGINEVSGTGRLAPSQSPTCVADLNANGRIDLVSIGEGRPQLSINQTENPFHQLSVRFKGIADNAAASGRVNHYAIGSVLELRFGPYYRSRIVRSPSTHFGMDGIDSAENIRVIMPNGLTQTIRNPKIDSTIEEEQTLKGSCPYLYSWDGEKFTFVTDCLWAAPLGLQVAAGQVQKDRPWEYLKIDGDLVQENEQGEYELRLTEELWEVAYVDKIELTAVDHPADVEVYSNEKVGPPNIAERTIYSFSDEDLHPIVEASDTAGRDVTERLASTDKQFVQGFDRRIRQGLCPPHWIDMNFGAAVTESLNASPNQSAYLVLRGWILPTDTSLNIQIDQNPELPAIEFPSVWVPESEGATQWKQAIGFMGFPGGKTKTIVVDVTDHLLSEDPRLRVRTSAQIYWDSAALAVQSEPSRQLQQPVQLLAATVAPHGFSKRSKPDPLGPETYDYQDAEKDPKWPPLYGVVTRYGSCIDLLSDWDDAMVVISGGDEIQMRFRPPANPIPQGWKRDFILHCVGWDKDADLNTLTGQSIGPLPLKEMSGYPPTAASAEQFDAVRDRNSTTLRRRQSFRGFWRRGSEQEKAFLPVRFPG